MRSLKNSCITGMVVLLLSTIAVSAQTVRVSGFITDSDSGESLPGATVSASVLPGSSANAYGFYSIAVESGRRNLLTISFIGYEEHIVEINVVRDTTVNILLAPRNLSIDEVTVTAKVPMTVVGDMGKVSINVSQLKYAPLFLGEQDVFKYLQILPGVSAGKEGSSGVNIRGGSSDQTLILLDDVPIYNQAHAFGFISIFNGEALKTADVYKGYIAPEYGGRLSGVTAMQMRDGNRKEHHQSLQIGTLTASGMIEGPLKKDKGAYIVSARGFIPALFLKGWSAVQANTDKVRPYFGFYDVTAKLSFDFGPKNSIYASFYTGRDNLDIRLNDTESEAKSKSKAGFGWGNTIFSLRWSSVLRHNMFMSTTAYCSMLSNEKHSEYENAKDKYRMSADTRSRLTEFGYKSAIDHNISDFWTLNYGLAASLQKFRPQIIEYSAKGLSHRSNYGKMDLVTYGLFLNNKLSVRKFDFNLGARAMAYDNGERRKIRFESRLSASWNFDTNSSVWAAFVINTQPLFLMNRNYFAMPIDYWMPFEGRRLQTSEQIAIGGKTRLFGAVTASAEVYYKRMKNLAMVFDVESFLNDEGGIDRATGKAYGFELSFQHTSSLHSVMASYAYSKSERSVGGRSFPFAYDTPHDLNLFGTYDVLQREGRKHTLSLNVNWHTGIPYVISSESYPGAGIFDGSDVGSNPVYPNMRLINYFRTDLSYNMEKVKKNGVRNWQISILNISNHKNPYLLFNKNGRYKSITLIPFMPSFSYKRTF